MTGLSGASRGGALISMCSFVGKPSGAEAAVDAAYEVELVGSAVELAELGAATVVLCCSAVDMFADDDGLLSDAADWSVAAAGSVVAVPCRCR